MTRRAVCVNCARTDLREAWRLPATLTRLISEPVRRLAGSSWRGELAAPTSSVRGNYLRTKPWAYSFPPGRPLTHRLLIASPRQRGCCWGFPRFLFDSIRRSVENERSKPYLRPVLGRPASYYRDRRHATVTGAVLP
jgi:hypothetical protein